MFIFCFCFATVTFPPKMVCLTKTNHMKLTLRGINYIAECCISSMDRAISTFFDAFVREIFHSNHEKFKQFIFVFAFISRCVYVSLGVCLNRFTLFQLCFQTVNRLHLIFLYLRRKNRIPFIYPSIIYMGGREVR